MAIAGKVAPTYAGEWSESATYQQHTYVRYNGDCYVSKKPSTCIVPTNEEYWFLALKNVTQEQYNALVNGTTTVGNSASLGGETSSQWQTKIDNIQTTSKGELSQEGWYRVAEYSGNTTSILNGKYSNSCEIYIKRVYTNNNGESHKLCLWSRQGTQKFKTIGSDSAYHYITKIRYAYDSAKAYLEIYYSGSIANFCSIDINHPFDGINAWQAITPTLTSETVDGVTVTTTYDIPANASPVTDLDLFRAVKSYDNLDFNTALETGIYCSSKSPSSAGATNYPIDGTGILEVINGGKVITQNYYVYYGTIIYSRSKFYSDDWSEWKQVATTADLANYLPLSGGKLTSNLEISSNGVFSAVFVEDKTTKRRASFEVTNNGNVFLWDYNNNNHILGSDGNGTNTFYGKATGQGNPVAIQSSAPSDTSALWVDTANKVIKAYIDGAWTQVS